jgi:hypothetical protein
MEKMPNPMNDKTIDDLIQYLKNTGYEQPASWWKWTRDNDTMVYDGWSYESKAHMYLVAFGPNDHDTAYTVTTLFVTLGQHGHLCAEYAGCPIFETESEDEMLEWFESNCR